MPVLKDSADKVYYGNKTIDAVYFGADKIWPADYIRARDIGDLNQLVTGKIGPLPATIWIAANAHKAVQSPLPSQFVNGTLRMVWASSSYVNQPAYFMVSKDGFWWICGTIREWNNGNGVPFDPASSFRGVYTGSMGAAELATMEYSGHATCSFHLAENTLSADANIIVQRTERIEWHLPPNMAISDFQHDYF